MAIFIYTMIILNIEYVKKNNEEYFITGEIRNRYDFSIQKIRRKINQTMFDKSTICISILGLTKTFTIKPTGYAYGKISGYVGKDFLDKLMITDLSKIISFDLVMPYYDSTKFYLVVNL